MKRCKMNGAKAAREGAVIFSKGDPCVAVKFGSHSSSAPFALRCYEKVYLTFAAKCVWCEGWTCDRVYWSGGEEGGAAYWEVSVRLVAVRCSREPERGVVR
jgi:hypothetical protein